MAVGFYVTAFDDGRFKGFARGPFDRHADALAAVRETRARAEEADPFTCFYAWGTARLERPALPAGPMNRLFEIREIAPHIAELPLFRAPGPEHSATPAESGPARPVSRTCLGLPLFRGLQED